jgi:hypothetical protein
MRRFAVLLLVFALIAPPVGASADGLSLYVDFDGTGHGQLFHGSLPPTPSLSSDATTTTSATATSAANAARWRARLNVRRDVPSPAQMETFEQDRLRQQQAEAQALLVQARIEADRGDRAARLARLDQLWETNDRLDDDAEDQDARTRIRIRDAMPEFFAQQAREHYAYDAQLRRLSAASLHVTVPYPQHCESILLMGVGETARDAAVVAKRDNPFTPGRPYGCGVFGFAAMPDFFDLVLRGAPDHILRSFDLLSPLTLLSLHRLWGEERSVPIVVAHSNGATVAEVLIRSHRLVGVRELRILGGDGALMHLDSLQKLADDYNIKITVYAIKGDPVTLAATGWELRALGELLKTAMPEYARQPNFTNALFALARRPADPNARLQVKLLDYPSRWNPLDYHPYVAYEGVLKGLQRMNCLEASTIDSRCRVSY